MRKFFFLSALAFTLLFSQTAQANLVINGDFQHDYPLGNMYFGWTSNAYGTNFALERNNAAGLSYSPGEFSQTISTIAGASYTFSFWLKQETSGATQNIYPYYPSIHNFQASWNGSPVTAFSSTVSFDWTQYTFTVQATGPTTLIAFSGQETGGMYHIDNVSVVQASTVPIPAGVWLLGSGLIGLVGLRRKFRNYSM
jgi:hypothetical protein